MRNNSRQRKRERRLTAMHQVHNRIKHPEQGKGDKELTKDRIKQRLEQAKHELAILEKRVG